MCFDRRVGHAPRSPCAAWPATLNSRASLGPTCFRYWATSRPRHAAHHFQQGERHVQNDPFLCSRVRLIQTR